MNDNEREFALSLCPTKKNAIMRIRLLLAAIWAVGAPLFGQEAAEKVVPTSMSQGYFFAEMLKGYPRGTVISMLKDSEGHRVFLFVCPEGESLADTLKAKALPRQRVLHADELLEKAERFEQMHWKKSRKDSVTVFREGAPFPRFRHTDIDGEEWSNEQVKGRVMVLNVWYSGCGPCLKEMPELSTWKDAMPDVVFLSANFEKEEEVRRITTQRGFNWHHLANDDQFIRLFGQNGFPMTVVVDKEGIVRSIVHGTSVAKRAAIRQKIEEYRQK